MMRFILVLAAALQTTSALAQMDPLGITPQEKSACAFDAARFCASTYPDEMNLVSCMKTNRASLTRTCLRVFDAGLKRRGL